MPKTSPTIFDKSLENMKLENQLSSLEASKRLRELGVPQRSYFYWIEERKTPYNQVYDNPKYEYVVEHIENPRKEFCISAFTVAELGEMFPLMSEGYRTMDGRWVYTHKELIKDKNNAFKEETEADARAKMLIYLLENKIITL